MANDSPDDVGSPAFESDPLFFDSVEDAMPPELGGKEAPPPSAWARGARNSAEQRPRSGRVQRLGSSSGEWESAGKQRKGKSGTRRALGKSGSRRKAAEEKPTARRSSSRRDRSASSSGVEWRSAKTSTSIPRPRFEDDPPKQKEPAPKPTAEDDTSGLGWLGDEEQAPQPRKAGPQEDPSGLGWLGDDAPRSEPQPRRAKSAAQRRPSSSERSRIPTAPSRRPPSAGQAPTGRSASSERNRIPSAQSRRPAAPERARAPTARNRRPEARPPTTRSPRPSERAPTAQSRRPPPERAPTAQSRRPPPERAPQSPAAEAPAPGRVAGRIDPLALGDIFRRASVLRSQPEWRHESDQDFGQRLLAEVFAQARPSERRSDQGPDLYLEEFQRSLENLFDHPPEPEPEPLQANFDALLETPSLLDELLTRSGEILFEGDIDTVESLLLQTYQSFERSQAAAEARQTAGPTLELDLSLGEPVLGQPLPGARPEDPDLTESALEDVLRGFNYGDGSTWSQPPAPPPPANPHVSPPGAWSPSALPQRPEPGRPAQNAGYNPPRTWPQGGQ